MHLLQEIAQPARDNDKDRMLISAERERPVVIFLKLAFKCRSKKSLPLVPGGRGTIAHLNNTSKPSSESHFENLN